MNKPCAEEVSAVAQKLLKPDVSPVRWSWARANQHSTQHAVKCTNTHTAGCRRLPPSTASRHLLTLNPKVPCVSAPTNGLQEGWFLPVVSSTQSPAEHTEPWPHLLSRPGDPLGATDGHRQSMPPSTGQTPPGSSQSQGPREAAPTPAPRASVWNPGGGLRSLPRGLPFVFLTGFLF